MGTGVGALRRLYAVNGTLKPGERSPALVHAPAW